MTLQPFFLHDGKMTEKKTMHAFAVLKFECDTFKAMNNLQGTLFLTTFLTF